MSQAGSAGSSGGGGGGGVTTINGDTGSITGSTVTIFANVATLNSGSTVEFVNSGTTSTFNVTDGLGNTVIGNSAGQAGLSGSNNTGLGSFALNNLTSGAFNTGCGAGTLADLLSGQSNTACGDAVLENLATGAGNTAIGVGTSQASAGSAYTGAESYNLLLNNVGVLGESNVIRIGTQGSSPWEQNTTFIAGIVGNSVSNAEMVTINSATGQMGVQSIPGGAAEAFSAYCSTNQANVLGGSAPGPYTIPFNATTRNDGGAYSTGSGLFTAPSDGFYCFCATIYLNSAAGFTAGTEVLVTCISNVDSQVFYQKLTIDATNASTNTCLPYTFMRQMTAGDTIGVTAFCNNLNEDVSIVGNPLSPSSLTTYTSFSGFKAG